MKRSILSLLVIASLVSCQQEYSQEGANEDIFKKRNERKLNFDGLNGGESEGARDVTVQSAPFDFGISAVLGAGALLAVRNARKRRQTANEK